MTNPATAESHPNIVGFVGLQERRLDRTVLRTYRTKVDLDDVVPNGNQPRMGPKEDAELQRQIEANEGLFEPLLVEPHPDLPGKFRITALHFGLRGLVLFHRLIIARGIRALHEVAQGSASRRGSACGLTGVGMRSVADGLRAITASIRAARPPREQS